MIGLPPQVPDASNQGEPLPSGWPPRASGQKTPPVERRKRRETVEMLLIDRLRPSQIQARVSAEFGVSARQIRDDIHWVQRQWDIEDRRTANRLRQSAIRRLERVVDKLEKAGKLYESGLLQINVCRLRGLGARTEIDLNLRGRVEHVHRPERPDEWLREVAQGLAEMGLLQVPGLHDALPDGRAEVVKVETTKGHAHDGNGKHGGSGAA